MSNSPPLGPTIFQQLYDRRIFIVARIGDKTPVNPNHADPASSFANCDGRNASTWMLPAEALAHVARLGAGYGVGIALSPETKLACIDIDKAKQADGTWSTLAQTLTAAFAGAYIETSISGGGRHIIFAYTGEFPPHASKNTALRIELYHELRYILLTGTDACGLVSRDCTMWVPHIVATYFTAAEGADDAEWTEEPHADWQGPEDDQELIDKMLTARPSAGAVFGNKATVRDLWECNVEALARAFPPQSTGKDYDASSADLALANTAAFYTGGDCDRMARIMLRSGLKRDKWDRVSYFNGTILKAAKQKNYYKQRAAIVPAVTEPPRTTADGVPLPPVANKMPRPFTVIHYGLLRTNLRQEPIADEENVRLLLEGEPNLRGIVRFNEFSGELLLVRPITSDPDLVSERGLPRPWTDADTATLQTFIQKHYIPKIARERIDAIVSMHARQRSAFHPVREYLQSLSWDNTPRLDTWLREYMTAGAQSPAYLAAVGAAWLISAVARIFEPGCQADCALVLEGDQGIRKSTALRILAGDDNFSDSLPADLNHKDARDHLRGKWIIELPELAQFRRTEIETVKAFLSRRHEQYRPSYGRHEVKFPRQCVMAGSTNDTTYLVDTTGNRRFWVVGCTRVNLESLRRDRDQIWAEAAVRYRAGEPWHLEGALEAMAAAEASERVAHDPWTSQVAEIVSQRLPGVDASPGEVMAHMNLPTTERHARNATRVGTILGELGWKRGKRDRTRGQLYVRGATARPVKL